MYLGLVNSVLELYIYVLNHLLLLCNPHLKTYCDLSVKRDLKGFLAI